MKCPNCGCSIGEMEEAPELDDEMAAKDAALSSMLGEIDDDDLGPKLEIIIATGKPKKKGK